MTKKFWKVTVVVETDDETLGDGIKWNQRRVASEIRETLGDFAGMFERIKNVQAKEVTR